MSKRLSLGITGIMIVMVLYSCKKEPDEKVPPAPPEIIKTNEWIYENMNQYYYWNDQIPAGIDHTRENDPEKYFYKLLYEKDKWSSISSDYKKLESELSGDPVTMGYYPQFFMTGPNRIVIAVGYVYPGSAAADAGLKRGDIILTINNTSLDTTNYYTLYSGTNYSVQLGAIRGNSLESTGRSLSMTARTTLTDPSIYRKVFDIAGKKIGYLVYTEFISGDNNLFLQSLDNIFTEFKAAGVTELIVDLRYNPGGDINSAIHLGSNIGPASAVTGRQIMVNLKYNAELQEYLEFNKRTEYLYYKFQPVSVNLDLKRVFFLTTSRTASASELLITGLEPYMNVVTIGEPTYGKYAGAWVIPDDEQKWAIMPIVTKYANSQGYTDFENGLPPDHNMDDDLFTAVPFGDATDPFVAKAIQQITGTTVVKKGIKAFPSESFRKFIPSRIDNKKNLWIPALKQEELNRYPLP